MKNISTLIILLFSLSANGQITWSSGLDISTNTYSNERPQIAVDRAGNPMVVWGRMSDESVFFSKWNGTIFTQPVKLNPTWLTVATADWMGPSIASHGDTVYVVVKRTPDMIDSNRIFIFTSFNGGGSFNAPVELAFIGDSISWLPTVTTDPTGNPIIAYMKLNSSHLDSRWVVTKSNDYGTTFSSDVKASGWGNSAEVCDCCPGTIISSGNTTAMLYRDNNLNMRDIWTGISYNNATSFSSGFEIDNNNWMVLSCPASGPDGVIIGDTLYATFMSRGGGSFKSYLSKSSISNGSLISVANLTSPITGLTLQNFPRIASDGNAMAIIWRQIISGSAHLPILFTNNIANGFPAAYDTVDIDHITNVDIALSNGNIYVVWQDDNSGTVKFRSGTYSPSTTGLDEVNQQPILIYPNPSKEFLNIKAKDNSQFSLKIFNTLGAIVYSGTQKSDFQLSISDWTNGIYLIQINTISNSFTQKFIKQ